MLYSCQHTLMSSVFSPDDASSAHNNPSMLGSDHAVSPNPSFFATSQNLSQGEPATATLPTRRLPSLSSYPTAIQNAVRLARRLYITRLGHEGPGLLSRAEKSQFCKDAFLQARSHLQIPSKSFIIIHRDSTQAREDTIIPDKYIRGFVS
jgi:hypothetical protein